MKELDLDESILDFDTWLPKDAIQSIANFIVSSSEVQKRDGFTVSHDNPFNSDNYSMGENKV